VGLIHQYPKLCRKILQIRNSDNIVPITLDGWEERIIPAVFELQKTPGIQRLACCVENKEVSFLGNDPVMTAFLQENFPQIPPHQPQFHLYVFSGIKDLGILRRMNEFPDETPRAEIEDSWVGVCEEASSMMITNPIYV
jgi:hypothetical protein